MLLTRKPVSKMLTRVKPLEGKVFAYKDYSKQGGLKKKPIGNRTLSRITGELCDKCGNHIVTDGDSVWCSYIKCDFYWELF